MDYTYMKRLGIGGLMTLFVTAASVPRRDAEPAIRTEHRSAARGPGIKCTGSDDPSGTQNELQLVFSGKLSDDIIVELVRGTPGEYPNVAIKAPRNRLNLYCASGKLGGVVDISGPLRPDTVVVAHAGLTTITVRTAKESARLEYPAAPSTAVIPNRRCHITQAQRVRCDR